MSRLGCNKIDKPLVVHRLSGNERPLMKDPLYRPFVFGQEHL